MSRLRRHAQVGSGSLIGLVVAIFLLLRLKVLVLPRFTVLGLVFVLVVMCNVSLWGWVDGRLAGPRQAPGQARGRRAWLRGVWAVHLCWVLGPLFLFPLGGRHLWDALPVPAIMYVLIWHLLTVFLVVGSLTVWAAWWMIRKLRLGTQAAADCEPPTDPGRRSLLARAAAAAPFIIVGGSVASGLMQAGRFRVRRLTMRLPRLPDRLEGLTLTHLSDVHLGRLFRPEHLPRVVAAANALRSDLVVVTGDLIDHSNDFLPLVCDALAGLEHRHGRFVTIGNHDLIDSPREMLRYLEGREPGLLRDECAVVSIGGEAIQIAGLFWSAHEGPVGADPGYAGRAGAMLKNADPQRFTIALAHHPHAFDVLADRGVDLTLAGHTHGGQLMLTPPHWPLTIGAGNLIFRYIWGEYRRGASAMYVNAGVGNWFPIRLNAPAEMVQIQLV